MKIPGLVTEDEKMRKKPLPRQTILLNNGVKKPTKSNAPMIIATNPKNHDQFCESSLANK